MPISQKLKDLVAQMPDPDDRGMYTKNIDKAKTDKAVAEIAAGGTENVVGLIEMLGSPGSAEDVKPHYALHCVINHTLIDGDAAARKQFCQALADRLGGDLTPYQKAFLCQELQWAGREEAIPALARLLLDEELVEPASMAMVALGRGASTELLAALPKARGACRLGILHALAALADPKSRSVLTAALTDGDREIRLAAGAGLAKIGDPESVDLLLAAADVPHGWERIQQTKHCLVLAENLAKADKKEPAAKIYNHLRQTRKDPSEKYLRDAADKALAAV